MKEGTYIVDPRIISILNYDKEFVPADSVNGRVAGIKVTTTTTTTTETTT